MSDRIYTIQIQPGIKRDGTQFESRTFTDGEWCRFQRGMPRKVNGARLMAAEPNDIIRGILSKSINGNTYVWTGTKTGVNGFITSNNLGLASGPFPVTFSSFGHTFAVSAIPANNQIQTPGDQTNTGTGELINGGTIQIYDPTNSTDYNYTLSNVTFSATTNRTSADLTPSAGAPTVVSGTPGTGEVNPSNFNVYSIPPVRPGNTRDAFAWTFDIAYDPSGFNFSGIGHFTEALITPDTTTKYPVFFGPLLPDTSNGLYEWSGALLRDVDGENPTGAIIEADGGVVALYPFIFVSGSAGFIANNHVTSFDVDNPGQYGTISLQDWNGPTANSVNVSSGKILTAIPVRGGTTSPSGLFWATDALIRVSFTGQTPLYWRYDLVSTDCTTLSKDCVIEQDGIYYWVGIDRFYLYNGTVQTLPNDMNLNYFFDNLNFSQRGKVFGVSVKRFNEIWWFYPHGQDQTECNNAIVYNTKDKIWYDMGRSPLCQRSAAVPAQVFPYPVMASNEFEFQIGSAFELVSPTNITDLVVEGNVEPNLPGSYITFDNVNPQGNVYRVASATFNETTNLTTITLQETLSEAPAIGSYIYQYLGGYGFYQHEFGRDKIFYQSTNSILSSFTTNDISFIGGDPSQDAAAGTNRRIKIFRVEPDFVQSGDMTLEYFGRGYSRGPESKSDTFIFTPTTEKIDTRVEYRQVRLKFSSNSLDGHYEMGRNMIIAVPGDERA